MTNKALVTNFFEAVFNQHDINAADRFLSEGYVRHTAGTTGREPFKGFFRMIFSGLSNYHVTLLQVIAEGDRVVVYNTIEGDHTGLLMGNPPTGRHIKYDAIDIYRVEGEQLTEHWAVVDLAALTKQLSNK